MQPMQQTQICNQCRAGGRATPMPGGGRAGPMSAGQWAGGWAGFGARETLHIKPLLVPLNYRSAAPLQKYSYRSFVSDQT